MKNNKNDQRSKYTQMLIKNSLLKLAINKPLNKITIAELCTNAGTNRVTFYSHFYDIYDVYETIENDFFNEIMQRLGQIKSYGAEISLIREIILQLYRNADMCNLIIGTNSNIISKILNAVQTKYIAEISSEFKQIPLDILNSLFIFQINGNVGLIFDWVKNGMKQTPEEITDLMVNFNRYVLDGIIKHYNKNGD